MTVPISDAAFAVIRRKLAGQPVSKADNDHLHHRLLELGIGQRNAVLSIYLVSMLFGGLGLISGFVPVSSGGPIAGLAILGLFVAAYRAGLLSLSARRGGKRHSGQSAGGQG
jgi:UDP-GlcNAc:undecaprenyl-phosphate GlcNAc-1-phosphate transferase